MIQINSITIFYCSVIFILIVLIIYLNIIAGIKFSKGLIIDIDKPIQCNYNNLPLLDESKVCKNGDFYYKSPGDGKNSVYYILGKNPVFYLNVCKSICGGSTQINGQCGEKNPIGYDVCISDLQPQNGCKNTAVPLVKDSNNTFYYAQEVSISLQC